MKFKEVIGIDVGKITNEARIHTKQVTFSFDNNSKGFKSFLKWTEKNINCPLENLLIAFEHTGIYSFPLSVFLTEEKINYIILPGLEIKRSLGIQRGKDDKIDAQKIALYAYRRKEEITPYKLPSKEFIKIRRLLSLREKLVKQRAGYEATLKENKKFLIKKGNQLLFNVHKKMIKELNKQIKKVDDELQNIIAEDEQIKNIYDLIITIKGVGPQTALFVIALTNGFTLFKNYRKFASYAGIAPFPYKSGISIKGRTKINHLANKKIKGLLSSCATSAVQYNPEMKAYYERRISEGKHKMSTLNIVRNKILARIFAVAKRGTPYVNTLGYSSL
ncbi:MAG: IS110 family transposase [Bacteroidota bacterium]|nr:IS110 family transposase [Bacteroidota bacterium]